MTQPIIKYEPALVEAVTQQDVESFLFSSGTALTAPQKTLFMELAIACKLNPFKREIYAIKYGNEFNVVVGYQIYIQRAEKSGDLDGWKVDIVKNDKQQLEKAVITIYRKSFSHPFIWEVYWEEVKKPFGLWKTAPSFMLRKVAIGQGFRLAFPAETKGLPYTAEEIAMDEPTVVTGAHDNHSKELQAKPIEKPLNQEVPGKKIETLEDLQNVLSECKSIDDLMLIHNSLPLELREEGKMFFTQKKRGLMGIPHLTEEEMADINIIIEKLQLVTTEASIKAFRKEYGISLKGKDAKAFGKAIDERLEEVKNPVETIFENAKVVSEEKGAA